MAAWVFLTTVPGSKTARKIARSLVELRLAACVNLLENATSFYRWQGKQVKSREALLVIKAPRENFDRIERYLRMAHPYELPELIAWPVSRGSSKYLAWVEASVREL